ncbi:sensor histidine kinase [Sphingobacterium sp. Mn56C]|uniref:sensor histidine kinase n=1 Tax=Sphingobacterium sp. Mn56C TaxID=3395261 RepID=UPI003BC538BB
MRKVFENKWMVEFTLLVFSFILFTLNDWILILSWKGFFMGVIYFLILYSHAQFNRFLLLPILIKKNNPLGYILSSVTVLLLFSLVLRLLTENVIYKNCFLYKDLIQNTFHYQFGVLLGTLICILGSIQFIEYYRYQRQKTKTELLSNQTQIDYLKKQLNPHFLFNTLNTVYGISLKFPERTSEMIIKVSQLLRYQLENTKKEYVCLADEIDFIANYIELENERVGYRSKIEFVYPENIECHYQIAPMLLITYVENAFKHGTCSLEDCFIKIVLELRGGVLHLSVKNSIPERKSKIQSTRIGLENAKARLEHMYPKRYQLNIHAGLSEFNVSLQMELS